MAAPSAAILARLNKLGIGDQFADPLTDATFKLAMTQGAGEGAGSRPAADWHDFVIRDGGKSSGGGGGGLLGALKNLGSNALKALATPGSALVTTAGNLGHVIAGDYDKHHVPWSDLVAPFHDRSAGADVLKSVGVKNKWALGLGGGVLDLGVDPLLPLGFAKIPKLAKAGEEILHAGEAASDATRATKTAEKLSKIREAGPQMTNVRRAASDMPEMYTAPETVVKAPVHERYLNKLDQPQSVRTGLDEQRMATPAMVRQGLSRLRKWHTADVAQEGTLGLKYGFGKHAVQLNTGIKLPSKTLKLGQSSEAINKALNRKFVLSPLQKVTRRMQVGAANMREGIEGRIAHIQKELGLDHTDATRLGVYAQARAASPELGAAVKHTFTEAGHWKPEMDTAFKHMNLTHQDMSKLRGGEMPFDVSADYKYFPQGPSGATREALRKKFGAEHVDLRMSREQGAPPGINTLHEREFPHGFAGTTREDFVKQLTDAGLEPDEAEVLSHSIDAHLGMRDDGVGFAENPVNYEHIDPAASDIIYQPEYDAFELFRQSNRAHVNEVLDQEINKLLDETGLAGSLRQGVHERLTKSVDTKRLPGTIGSLPIGEKLQRGTSKVKAAFTVAMPAHFVRNAAGDWFNSFVNGNARHFFAGPLVRGKYLNMVKGDDAALHATYMVNGEEIDGFHLLARAQMSGLGFHTNQTSQEISAMRALHEAAGGPVKRYMRYMEKLNVNRDDAQRLRTWVLHMDAGDDMFTAAAKTLRVHFDYGELTPLEKTWMRNLILFYSWMRKNTALHVGGMATRPGLYSASQHIETDRPKLLNEPGYFSQNFMLPIPGVGNFDFGNPVGNAVQMLNLSNLRRNTLGQLNPFIKAPLEYGTDTDLSTGAQLDHGIEGLQKPSGVARALNAVGLGGLPGLGTAAGHVREEPSPSIDAKVLQILNGFMPPVGHTIDSGTNPANEQGGLLNIVSRLTGITPEANAPEKYAKMQGSAAYRVIQSLRDKRKYNQAP